ncbi:hypothetical protein NG827_09445 [Xanthomonas sacchari]|uniref:hypothetical protein n=1 Tax=Xanthomonas TaxID=338 RepID=UPI00047685BD|nr:MULTISPECIES: hypothetical protein [Xanthomonas]UYK86600.1 hypothetical protein NG827_09445 [Xanthomonas sacchari]
MRKSILAISFLAAVASASAIAGNSRLNPDDVIQGMGERLPVGKQNVSLSPLFKVYTFEKAGLKFVQINSLKDEVITVVSVTPGVDSVLPIGSAAEKQMVSVSDEKNQPMGMVTAAASCPCNATVVYRDSITTIVVIYDKDGNFIESYRIPTAKYSAPK